MENENRKLRLDSDIEDLISIHGLDNVIASLARYCHMIGREGPFKRLNKIYEWLVSGRTKVI